MRNRYSAPCYLCSKTVAPGAGHFERHRGGWRAIHAECVFVNRERKQNAKAEEVKP